MIEGASQASKPSDSDRLHSAVVGLRQQLSAERERRRRAETENQELQKSLVALFTAWNTITNAQEPLRRLSGVELPRDLLRLATQLPAPDFEKWLRDLEGLAGVMGRPPHP